MGSDTNTWVTAPTSMPFCISGDPLMPCTIPPVRSRSPWSVMRITMCFPPARAGLFILTISTLNSSMVEPFTTVSIVAGPSVTADAMATGTPPG